jgi:hypothetical protein
MTEKKDPKDFEKVGRPTKYDPVMNKQVFMLAKKGFINSEMAELLGVCETTIQTWKKEYPEFMAAIKRGKDMADMEVEKSLYERAMGFDYEETKTIAEQSGEGENSYSKKKIEKHTKKALPDVTAMIFFLKNRKPEKWRDRHDHSIVDNTDYERERRKMDEIAKKAIEEHNK